ncbi:hypothetical protein DUI87_03733 [Hirundo rustica rustica]|uniref:Integrase catalytic domain-containing protein n=1 Tax=Hirundo rustica rustica TaxID=333673 RepID=A0A3M0L0V6_HIRRU|nr:hypothetical protein DUI87_03733 [Hirundo rustica rustica]
MDSISQVIHNCETCAAIKQAKRVKPLWYGGRWLKYRYGEAWQIDYITLPQTHQGKHYVLTMVEATTGWLETYPVPHATARNTILGLEKQVLWRHGTPERIKSDNGTHFKNGLINTWAREHGIEWIDHISYYAPAAGKVERCNGLLKTTLKALGGGTFKNWEVNLAKATWMVNTRGSINRAGPAQSEPLHTVDGDKVPVVHMKAQAATVFPEDKSYQTFVQEHCFNKTTSSGLLPSQFQAHGDDTLMGLGAAEAPEAPLCVCRSQCINQMKELKEQCEERIDELTKKSSGIPQIKEYKGFTEDSQVDTPLPALKQAGFKQDDLEQEKKSEDIPKAVPTVRKTDLEQAEERTDSLTDIRKQGRKAEEEQLSSQLDKPQESLKAAAGPKEVLPESEKEPKPPEDEKHVPGQDMSEPAASEEAEREQFLNYDDKQDDLLPGKADKQEHEAVNQDKDVDYNLDVNEAESETDKQAALAGIENVQNPEDMKNHLPDHGEGRQRL